MIVRASWDRMRANIEMKGNKMQYTTVLSDLDGTLTESAPGIVNSAAHALEKFGIHVEDKNDLLCFVGPPLIESFQKYYGLDEVQAVQAVSYYREYYSTKGLFENKLIDGIPELLLTLKSAGKQLLVATSKPEFFSEQIISHYWIRPYFTYVAGATMYETRTAKSEVIAYAMEQIPGVAKENIVMVGDRHHDVDGAIANGLDSIGVTFGYGDRAELADAGATYIVDSVAELQNLLLQNS